MVNTKTGGAEYYRRIKRAYGDASDGEIAKSLRTTRQAVSLWKTNKSEPDGNKLIRAAEVTGVRHEWFTTGEDHFFTQDTSLRPYSGPEHHRLAAIIDSEFKRVAKLEDIPMAELVTEVAAALGIPERNLYNYRTGKWSIPASIVPALTLRFRSVAIVCEMLGASIEVAIKPLLDGLEKQMRTALKK